MNLTEKLLKLNQNVLSHIRFPCASGPGFASGQGAEGEVGQGLGFGGLTCCLAVRFSLEDFGAGKDVFPLCVGLGAALYCSSHSLCQRCSYNRNHLGWLQKISHPTVWLG